jgi:mono/diheme cytochrome c family protein
VRFETPLRILLVPGLCLGMFLLPTAAQADAAKDLYIQNCASCHTIGDGDRVGPDLKGVHETRDPDWLHTIIQRPSRLLDSDPIAQEMLRKYNNVRMPDLGMTDEQTKSLIELIARCSDEPCDFTGDFVPAVDATPADVELGRRLFVGLEPFESGGAACVACHTATGAGAISGGGNLATDLTHAFARLGDDGLDAALKNPTFALMDQVYRKHPLDADEVFALRAFLNEANKQPGAPDSPLLFILAGLGGAACSLVVLNAAWSRRLRGVRGTIARRQP